MSSDALIDEVERIVKAKMEEIQAELNRLRQTCQPKGGNPPWDEEAEKLAEESKAPRTPVPDNLDLPAMRAICRSIAKKTGSPFVVTTIKSTGLAEGLSTLKADDYPEVYAVLNEKHKELFGEYFKP